MIISQEIIKEFFEEELNKTSTFFLYNDKKLLEQGKYVDFARIQIRKARKVFSLVLLNVCFFSAYGIISLIEYGENPNLFDLVLGLSAWGVLLVILVYSAREYYSTKSSMAMLVRLVEEQQNTQY
ncbi:hypothetical protein NC796_11135 [Aliifodinibius sp. S!AR15-10]|uniref:hypothetical protein n=1 Tax=Aliifodinibius sp. S!AR15-10 TaxID=2950437 RepID=UPI00285895BB|nr:hypothetical protein [Aliifodinibius sp. S!AR15-10]MDR8391699.1 hypothetical protein [Aliifodinibius sp. S!AR15-10]